jgi:hypothetical protein
MARTMQLQGVLSMMPRLMLSESKTVRNTAEKDGISRP